MKERGQVCDERPYTDAEYEFGRDNIRQLPEAFQKRLKKLIGNIDRYLKEPNLQEESRRELLEKRARFEGVLRGEIK